MANSAVLPALLDQGEELAGCDRRARDVDAERREGVLDGPHQSGRGRQHAAFPDAFDADRIDKLVVLSDDFDILHVTVDGNMVLGEIMVHDPAEFLIDQTFLLQCMPIPQTMPRRRGNAIGE